MSDTQFSLTIGKTDVNIRFSQTDSKDVKKSIMQILTGAYEEKIESILENTPVM